MLSPHAEPPYIAERIVKALGRTIGWASVREVDRAVQCVNLERFKAGMKWAETQGWLALEYMGRAPLEQHACLTTKGIALVRSLAEMDQVEQEAR